MFYSLSVLFPLSYVFHVDFMAIQFLRTLNLGLTKPSIPYLVSNMGNKLEWWNSLEYQDPNANDAAISAWTGTYDWK